MLSRGSNFRNALSLRVPAQSLRRKSFYTSTNPREPLRVLFCGSDEFSIASLRALNDERLRNPKAISSLDVVCRPGKPTGRGLKKIRQVPIARVATDLCLPLHQIDTFTKWEPPTPNNLPINLVIAVSFGLKVPTRILSNAIYRGLNVHPSLLPQFRGPAPLHHILLAGVEETGVTVQTLHPERFDEGKIISQTPFPGFRHQCSTVPELLERVSQEGAALLVSCITAGAFVPPLQEIRQLLPGAKVPAASNAPKITPQDRHLDWHSWTAERILRSHRVIGPLWNEITLESPLKSARKRLIWTSGFKVSDGKPCAGPGIGRPFFKDPRSPEALIYIETCDRQILEATQITIDGCRTNDPISSFKQAGLFYSGTSKHAVDEDLICNRVSPLGLA